MVSGIEADAPVDCRVPMADKFEGHAPDGRLKQRVDEIEVDAPVDRRVQIEDEWPIVVQNIECMMARDLALAQLTQLRLEGGTQRTSNVSRLVRYDL